MAWNKEAGGLRGPQGDDGAPLTAVESPTGSGLFTVVIDGDGGGELIDLSAYAKTADLPPMLSITFSVTAPSSPAVGDLWGKTSA